MSSGNNGEWTLIDILSIMSFVIGLQNLELNITQNDLEEQTSDLDRKVDNKLQRALMDIHNHLEQQDDKINKILEVLKNARNL